MLLHHSLPGGVRLRLPHAGDADGLRALCARHGVACDPDALLHFDPLQRTVVCAASLSAGAEALVGVGAIDLHRGAEPDVLVADDEPVREHLRAALAARVASRAPRPRPPRRRDHPVRRVLRRARERL